MSRILPCIFALFLFIASYYALEAPVVDTDQFNNALQTSNNLLVLFTRLSSHSCPECDLAEDAIAELDEEQFDCVAVTVDCDENEGLCRKYEFRHLPQVFLFNEEVGIYDYREPIVYSSALEEFLEVHLAPKSTVIYTTKDLEKEIQDNKVLIVGFFLTGTEEKSHGSFKRTAGQLFTEYKFVEVLADSDDAGVFRQNDAVVNTIRMYKHFGGEVVSVTYEEEKISRRKIANWIDANAPWLVKEGEPKFTSSKDAFRDHSVLVAYLDYENEALKEEIVAVLELVADSFKRKISFFYTNGNDEKYVDIFSRWGSNAALPLLFISNPSNNKVYLFQEEEVNQFTVGTFCDNFVEKSLEPYVIKQEVPEENEGKVKVIVHDTWRSIVHDASSDVIVFFYLPLSQCSHCVPFLEKYEALAEELDIPGLVFAKLDAHANADVPGSHVTNFPTIQLFPMSNKFQEITFSGPRNVEALENWIRSSLSVKTNRFTEEEQRLGLGDVVY